MRRSFVWTMLCVLVVIAAPLVTQLVVPAGVARAQSSCTSVAKHDEVVTLTPGGEIVVSDVCPRPGMKLADWSSGADAGWQYVAAGDFRGDGHEEIVAIGGNRLKVFDPFPLTGQPVTFERTLSSGVFDLITTGDFNRDGKDEIAATSSSGPGPYLWVYNVLGDSVIYSESFGFPWLAITTGDFNNDGADDLAMVRTSGSILLKVYNGLNWSQIAERGDSFPWITLAAGKLSSPYVPDQLALLRTGVNGDALPSLIFFGVDYNNIYDILGDGYKFNPNFTSLALGNLTTGQQQLIFILRDSQDINRPVLTTVNPTGLPVRTLELWFDNYWAWKQVRTGDMDGDGLSEVVILSADHMRVYKQPEANDGYVDVPGSYRLQPTDSDWPVMVLANLDGPGVPATPTLTVLPASLSFNVPWGNPGPQQSLKIDNSGVGSIGWTAQVTEGNSWLKLGALSGATPGTLFVTVSSTDAGVGPHAGTIKITATTPGVLNSPQNIPVDLTVPDPGFVVYPTQTTIWQQIVAGAPVVTRQIEILRPGIPTAWVATALPASAAAGLEEKLASGQAKVTGDGVVIDGVQVPPPTWLVFKPDSGTTRTVMTANVQTSTPGVYHGVIVIVAQDPTVTNRVQWVFVDAVVANQFNYNFLPLIMK